MCEIKEINKIKHYVINENIKTEKDIIKIIEDQVFKSGYYPNRFYPIILNNTLVFAWKNTKEYLHYYIKNEHYRVNTKKDTVHVDTIISKLDFEKLINEVRKDNIFLVDRKVII